MAVWVPPQKTGKYNLLMAVNTDPSRPHRTRETQYFNWQVIATDLTRDECTSLAAALLKSPMYQAAMIETLWTEGRYEDEPEDVQGVET